ncbi:MAG: hypothetical protein FJX65_08180 [Alphaproteobacteria bacterium]|nr:hypothetical protein [Alphaproteobacteria bacterium]
MSAGYVHLDTLTMPFAGVDSNPGARQQVLWRDAQTGATVAMNYGPAGFSPAHAKLLDEHGTHRHYHATVNERHYAMGGDYPIWHWAAPESEPTLTLMRRHMYVENPPRTLHGSQPHRRPQIATQMLVWNTGGGTSIFAADAKHETHEFPPGTRAPDNGPWARPRIVAVDLQSWRQHPTLLGAKIRAVAPTDGDQPAVMVVSVPPESIAPASLKPVPGASRRWLFLLSGDLRLRLTTPAAVEDIVAHEGHFVHWADAALTPGPGMVSEGGAVVLCVGHDLARSIE